MLISIIETRLDRSDGNAAMTNESWMETTFHRPAQCTVQEKRTKTGESIRMGSRSKLKMKRTQLKTPSSHRPYIFLMGI